MLAIVIALIVVIYLSFKYFRQLPRHKNTFEEYGISSSLVLFLQFSTLLFIVGLISYLALSWITELEKYRLASIMLLVPGIFSGRRASKALEHIGLDKAEKAKQAASNIVALGIGTGLFMVVISVLSYLISKGGSSGPLFQ